MSIFDNFRFGFSPQYRSLRQALAKASGPEQLQNIMDMRGVLKRLESLSAAFVGGSSVLNHVETEVEQLPDEVLSPILRHMKDSEDRFMRLGNSILDEVSSVKEAPPPSPHADDDIRTILAALRRIEQGMKSAPSLGNDDLTKISQIFSESLKSAQLSYAQEKDELENLRSQLRSMQAEAERHRNENSQLRRRLNESARDSDRINQLIHENNSLRKQIAENNRQREGDLKQIQELQQRVKDLKDHNGKVQTQRDDKTRQSLLDPFKILENTAITRFSADNPGMVKERFTNTKILDDFFKNTANDNIYYKVYERYLKKLNRELSKAEQNDDEIEEMLATALKVTEGDLLKKIMVSIRRAMQSGHETDLEKGLLSAMNAYLTSVGFYTRADVSVGSMISERDYDDMELIPLKPTSNEQAGTILNVELYPYYVKYLDEDGAVQDLCTQGRIVIAKGDAS